MTRNRDPRRTLEGRVLRFVCDRGALRAGERVLAAVSGGPDSTALLLILAALSSRLSVDLRAAYFDHGLRGDEAAREERAFLEELAGHLGVALGVGRGDVRAHARQHRLSLEQAAREMRYRFLARTAIEEGCNVVATGHTADDQVETVLLHLLRGSGLEGLAGMAPRGHWPLSAASTGGRSVRTGPDGPSSGGVHPAAFGGGDTPALARPLLPLRRVDTEAYCRAAGLSPLEDTTNLSTAFLRNRVRLELLPLLRRYNPRIDDALLRLTEAVRHDLEFLDKLASEALATGSSEGPGRVVLSRRRLAGLPGALQRHAVRLAMRCLVGDLREMQSSHVEALVRALGREVGHHLDLPRGLRLDIGYEDATLSLGPVERPQAPPETPLPVPGRLSWGPWSLETEVGSPGGGPPEDPFQAWLDADAVGGSITVRSRRRGDRFQPLGMAEEKKLQDLLVDAHTPRGERDLVPLVCSPKGIAWVGGVRIAQWARVRQRTRRVLKLRLSCLDSHPP